VNFLPPPALRASSFPRGPARRGPPSSQRRASTQQPKSRSTQQPKSRSTQQPRSRPQPRCRAPCVRARSPRVGRFQRLPPPLLVGPTRQDAICCRSSSQNRPIRSFLLTRRTNSSPVCPVFSPTTSPRPRRDLAVLPAIYAVAQRLPAPSSSVVDSRSPRNRRRQPPLADLAASRPESPRRRGELTSSLPFPPAQCRRRIRARSASRYAAEASSPPFSLSSPAV
jgi:hypothetical protein